MPFERCTRRAKNGADGAAAGKVNRPKRVLRVLWAYGGFFAGLAGRHRRRGVVLDGNLWAGNALFAGFCVLAVAIEGRGFMKRKKDR